MKVAYIIQGNIFNTVGVLNKILEQREELQKQQVDCELIIINEEKITPADKTITFIDGSEEGNKTGSLRTAYARLDDYMQASEADWIYFRCPFATYELYKFCKKYGYKIVFEHNTKELPEIKQRLFIRPSTRDIFYSLKHPFSNQYASAFATCMHEWMWGKKIRKAVRGGVVGANDIGNHQKERYANYQTKVIGNGINVSAVPVKKNRTAYGQEKSIHLISISGYKTDWHGIDRLLKGMANYTGEYKVKLYLIGLYDDYTFSLVDKLRLSDKVKILPVLKKEELPEYFDDADIAIAHLAIFRKKVNEHNVLRTREYFARGIPYVISHKEFDIEQDNRTQPYYLKVPHDASDINFADIVAFKERVYREENVTQKIRALAYEVIDISVKIRQLIDFFTELAQGRESKK